MHADTSDTSAAIEYNITGYYLFVVFLYLKFRDGSIDFPSAEWLSAWRFFRAPYARRETRRPRHPAGSSFGCDGDSGIRPGPARFAPSATQTGSSWHRFVSFSVACCDYIQLVHLSIIKNLTSAFFCARIRITGSVF